MRAHKKSVILHNFFRWIKMKIVIIAVFIVRSIIVRPIHNLAEFRSRCPNACPKELATWWRRILCAAAYTMTYTVCQNETHVILNILYTVVSLLQFYFWHTLYLRSVHETRRTTTHNDVLNKRAGKKPERVSEPPEYHV